MSQAVLEKRAGKRVRSARLEARITVEQKALIAHAAASQGRSVTDFVVTSLQDAARQALEDPAVIILSRRDMEVFAEEFVNPTPVNDRLRETIRIYREATGT